MGAMPTDELHPNREWTIILHRFWGGQEIVKNGHFIGLGLEFANSHHIDITLVIGESWLNICSTLIFTASETKPLSRKTTQSGL